jgi:hypothetical protein
MTSFWAREGGLMKTIGKRVELSALFDAEWVAQGRVHEHRSRGLPRSGSGPPLTAGEGYD